MFHRWKNIGEMSTAQAFEGSMLSGSFLEARRALVMKIDDVMLAVITNSCYDEGKRIAETLCFDFFRQYGVQIRVARIFNTYVSI